MKGGFLMPGLMTHYLCGKDILGYIYDDRIKNTILKHKDAYNLGLQGPDFYFYDMSHAAKSRGFNYGRLIHTNQTGLFLSNCLKAASLLSPTRREVALSYIYGFLGHFALDSICHPYIFYMSCFKIENDTDRTNSSTAHVLFETAIDTQMLLIKRGLTFDKLRRQDVIDIGRNDLNIISHIISFAFNKTFNQFTTATSVMQSFKNFRLTNMFIQNENEFKLRLVQSFEKNVAKASLISGIMLSKTKKFSWDVLNRNNAQWCLPWDSSAVSCQSFIDLYDDAALFASRLINDADSVVNFGTKPNDFLNKVGNHSYITGVDCNKVCTMKHFKNRTKEIVS